ncbi:MAG: glycosyltransferase [Lentisphaerae bacterium]|nr:glycosyltransferase [Lentisphaerota bacterium]
MSSKPLVVYLHRYPPEHEAQQFSGMRVFLDHLLEKFDVLYVSMRGVKPPAADLRRGLRFMEIPFTIDPASGLSKFSKTILFYLAVPGILPRLRRLEPDFIICKEPLPFIPIMVSRLGLPFMIASVSDFWWRIFLGGNRWGRRLAGWLERFEIRRWNLGRACVVANTKAEADLIEKRGMNRNRIFIINTTSPAGLYFPCDAQQERALLKLAPNDWVVAIHGTIRPGKGYGQLLEWWQALTKTHPNWRLLIIGGAGGEAWCRRQIRRLELERQVRMTGWLPGPQEVNRYLNAADCLLVVRRNSDDNQGIIPSALYHSLATGKPTVATGLEGMAEIVRHGVDGFLFEPDNFDSFRKVLEHIAEHPQEAARVGRAGMAREKECFDPVVAAEKNVEVIERMIRADGAY